MKSKLLGIFIVVAVILRAEIDPRAIEFSVKRLPTEKTEPYRYFRTESTYSIVILGGDAMNRTDPNKPTYRLLGFDQSFSFDELKTILTAFYSTFPTDAKVADERLGGPIPFPNIIYWHNGWNEGSQDGPNLVDALSRQHGVGLFYCKTNTYTVDIKESKREGVPQYDQACRDYYLQRLKEAMKSLGPSASSGK